MIKKEVLSKYWKKSEKPERNSENQEIISTKTFGHREENKDKLIVQTFDGLKFMEWKERGVKARVKNGYTHCHCNHLHLVIKKACEKNKESIYFVFKYKEHIIFFSKSQKSKNIEKKECTWGNLPTGSNTREVILVEL